MKTISIEAIESVKIGQTENAAAGTGCTVFLCEKGMRAGMDVRGGAPASRESQLLNPLAAMQCVHAVVLAGGSAFGLGAANGVMAYLEERGVGFDVGVTKVPIVVQSDLFDLTVGDAFVRPDAAMGYEAAKRAMEAPNYRDGNYGAGCGATVGKAAGMARCMKTGIGSYAVQVGELQVGAVVALNAFGDMFDHKTGAQVAGLLSEDKSALRSTVDFMCRSTQIVENKFMLLCDDTERDYGDAEVAASFKEKCDANGFHTVSMKNEFATLYPAGSRRMASKPDAGQPNAAPETQKTAAAGEQIPGWAADSPAMQSIVSYVAAITDETSPDYVPPEERVVLFDSDGTLIGERYPTYSDQCMLVQRLLHDETAGEGVPEDVAFAGELEAAILNHEQLPSSPRSTAQMAAESFAGFTVEEYQAYVREFLKQDVPGFEGMTYGSRFFAPMVELVRYLAEHDFQVYLCSGTERLFLRELIAGTLDEWIPPYRVIGSTFSLTATGQGDTANRSYTYAPDDQVLLEGNMIFKNLKMGKVISIVNEIGVPPVMVFGNSSGDFAMGQYALQHGGKAYMLLCDDTERDYGDTAEAEEFAAECAALGFETVSMRDEFETIYAEGIEKAEDAALQPAA